MDANSGEPWSDMDISDLKNEIARGRTIAQTAQPPLPGRGRGAPEGTTTRVDRASWQARPGCSLKESPAGKRGAVEGFRSLTQSE
jgi:hypothetical protein